MRNHPLYLHWLPSSNDQGLTWAGQGWQPGLPLPADVTHWEYVRVPVPSTLPWPVVLGLPPWAWEEV
jgi:hypothetical protein